MNNDFTVAKLIEIQDILTKAEKEIKDKELFERLNFRANNHLGLNVLLFNERLLKAETINWIDESLDSCYKISEDSVSNKIKELGIK